MDKLKRSPAAFALIAVFLAACGSSSTGAGSPSPTSSPTPSGPPSGTVATVGDANVAGTAKLSQVQCSEPSVDGPTIVVYGLTPSGVSLYVTIQAHMVVVRAATSSGTTYAQREFDATAGISGFDAARGAKVDATLTENKAISDKPGTIGAVKSVTLSVDCANQQPGSASITVTGNTAGGALGTGPLTSARADCGSYPQGKTASVVALTKIGGKTALIIIGVTWAGITVATGDGHFYTNTSPASGSATDKGGHWNGDVTDPSSGTKLHVSGNATCGSSSKTV